jgi:NAD(P)-dependent dehydrogenase (short-subunit alcohol dehydrogenase family)
MRGLILAPNPRRPTLLNIRLGGSEQRTAIVTGAARGIGAATAMALAARGIAPALFVRDAGAARGIAERIRDLGVACRVETCDVADYGSVRAALARTADAWGRLDAVINNAGTVEPMGFVADTDPVEWARAFAVNVVGAYHVVREALPLLLRQGGAVVNLSTGAAHTPRDGWSAYCGTKAALAMFTRNIAKEYGDKGVFAYSLQPGMVDTEMQVRIRRAGINEISRIPREQLDPPERSANVIAWLAAERPAELAGQDLHVSHPAFADIVVPAQAGTQ